MTGRRATLLLAAVAAAATPALSGCGSDPSYARTSPGRIAVRLSEYRITPEFLEVRAGRVRIDVRNTGRLTHNVAIVQFKRPLANEDERTYGKPTPTLFPGQTASTTVTLKPGKYRIVCTIANHDNLGQYGELKVTAR
jgi:plastocyanin